MSLSPTTPAAKDAEIGVTEIQETLLPSPRELRAAYPDTARSQETVRAARRDIRNILNHGDDRLLVVVGPCSIHDTDAAREYARRLRGLQDRCREQLLLVMRVYLEKPRTTIGWRGLVNDPYMDGSFDMVEGLRRSRQLLVDVTDRGVPVATELLDIAVSSYLTDLVSFGAIGARTTESQPHRAMASGLALPVGFKNGTDGGTQIALDAVVSAQSAHSYLSLDEEGRCCAVRTPGNADTLLILRGGRKTGPNYDPTCILSAEEEMERLGLRPSLMVDCSHANSGYDHTRQAAVCESVARQRRAGTRSLMGIMIESNLSGGKQSLPPVLSPGIAANLRYGVSVTDACMGWEETEDMLLSLAASLAASLA